MNILTSLVEKKYISHYIDTELSGVNDLIGDAIVYLTYPSVFADYILPKYFPERFQDSPYFLSVPSIAGKRKYNNLKVNITDDIIEISNYNGFNTDNIRKRISLRLVEKYLSPLLISCDALYGKETAVFNEEHMRSCFLVRMLGTYNLRNFEINDQLIIMCLIYKVLGTPINIVDQRPFLSRYFDSI